MFRCWGKNAFHKRISKSGDNATAANQAIESLLRLLREVAQTSGTGFKGRFKKDCTELSRRVAFLSHLVEEIKDFKANRGSFHMACSSSSFSSSIFQLNEALQAAKMLLQSAGGFKDITPPKKSKAVEFKPEFQSVNRKLEKALADFPYRDLEISDDLKEQVDLVRSQLKRATQGKEHGVKKSNKVLRRSDSDEFPDAFICPISRELMKDPVIVSTGQTYERSLIQRWIDSGKDICPKTCQKLKNKDLIPNHVLKNLIAEWCTDSSESKILKFWRHNRK